MTQEGLTDIAREVSTESQSEKVTTEYVEPKTFDEAWNHPNPKQMEFWRSAIRKEFKDMIAKKVWRKRHRSDVPDNCRCVKCKWVFKIKRNGVFRARLVACGYIQIPGVDCSDSYSPVVHDITFCALLLAMIVEELLRKIADVETTFLHGDLEEEIFM